MKRLVIVLVLAGGAFLFMQRTRTHVAAQQGFINPPTCCDQQHAELDWNTESSTCKGSAAYHATCTNTPYTDTRIASSCTGGNGGPLNVYYENGLPCEQIPDSDTWHSEGDHCPTTYTTQYWTNDPGCGQVCAGPGDPYQKQEFRVLRLGVQGLQGVQERLLPPSGSGELDYGGTSRWPAYHRRTHGFCPSHRRDRVQAEPKLLALSPGSSEVAVLRLARAAFRVGPARTQVHV